MNKLLKLIVSFAIFTSLPCFAMDASRRADQLSTVVLTGPIVAGDAERLVKTLLTSMYPGLSAVLHLSTEERKLFVLIAQAAPWRKPSRSRIWFKRFMCGQKCPAAGNALVHASSYFLRVKSALRLDLIRSWASFRTPPDMWACTGLTSLQKLSKRRTPRHR